MKTADVGPLLLLCSVMLGGCVTTGSKCLLTVSNSGDSPVTDVVVEIGGAVRYSSPLVGPHSDADYASLKYGVTVSPKLTWKTTNGVAVTKEVKLTKPLPPDFRGRILFQIDNASDVRMFLIPADESITSSIPWGNSGEWDGTMLIPGMTQK